MIKNNLGKGGGVYYVLQLTVHHQRKPGQELKQGNNLEGGADAEAMEGAAYWLAPPGLLSLLFYRTQDHQLRSGTMHNGLGPPTSITSEYNALQVFL